MAKITVQSTPVTVLSIEERDYISLTDMASAKEGGQPGRGHNQELDKKPLCHRISRHMGSYS